MSAFLPDLVLAWMTTMRAEALLRLAVALLAALAIPRVRSHRLVAGAALGLGLWFALADPSVVDDAFTAFRYARRLLDGDGLVFNVGERVEGYTDFLWVLLVAAGAWLTGAQLPQVALVLGVAAFVANLCVCAMLARALRTDDRVPVAMLLLALHTVFTAHATTGLETHLNTLFVQLGALAVVRGRAGVASAWFVAAMLTRPDAALFAVAGGLVAVRSWRQAVAYGLPLLAFTAVILGKWSYYGDFVPNTYWAKSAGLAYFSQGMVYVAEFWLGSHGWVLALLWIGWLAAPRTTEGAARLRLFTLFAFPAQVLYVAKVGGDFMAGRFFVCLLPLLLAAVEDLLHTRRNARIAAAVAGLLAMTARPTSLVEPGRIQWSMAQETSIYPLASFSPIVVRHEVPGQQTPEAHRCPPGDVGRLESATCNVARSRTVEMPSPV